MSLRKEDRRYYAGESGTDDFAAFLPIAMKAVDRIDPRSDREKRVGQAQDFLTGLFAHPDLRRLLQSQGLGIQSDPRENEYFYYYDITKSGDKIGCFAVDKYSAEIYMTDKDEVQIGSFRGLTGVETIVKKN